MTKQDKIYAALAAKAKPLDAVRIVLTHKQPELEEVFGSAAHAYKGDG